MAADTPHFPDEEVDQLPFVDPIFIDQALHERPHSGPVNEYSERDYSDVSEAYYVAEGEELDV